MSLHSDHILSSNSFSDRAKSSVNLSNGKVGLGIVRLQSMLTQAVHSIRRPDIKIRMVYAMTKSEDQDRYEFSNLNKAQATSATRQDITHRLLSLV